MHHNAFAFAKFLISQISVQKVNELSDWLFRFTHVVPSLHLLPLSFLDSKRWRPQADINRKKSYAKLYIAKSNFLNRCCCFFPSNLYSELVTKLSNQIPGGGKILLVLSGAQSREVIGSHRQSHHDGHRQLQVHRCVFVCSCWYTHYTHWAGDPSSIVSWCKNVFLNCLVHK